jgi:hypothetical protein
VLLLSKAHPTVGHGDTRTGDLDEVARCMNADAAGPTHAAALFHDNCRTLGDDPVRDEMASEGTRGAAGRGVLPDAHGWVEKPGVCGDIGIGRIRAEHVASLPAYPFEHASQPRGVRLRVVHGVSHAGWSEKMRGPGGHDLGG